MDISRVDELLYEAYSLDILDSRELTTKILKEVRNKRYKKNNLCIKRVVISVASLFLVIMLAMNFNEVKAAIDNIRNTFLSWCDEKYGNDVDGINSDFYQEGLLGEYNMSIDRLVFSDHEVYIGFSIDTDEIDKEDSLIFSIRDGKNVISDTVGANQLFSDCMTYGGQFSFMDMEWQKTEDNGKLEGFIVWQGQGLNYENRDVVLDCYLYDKETKEGYNCSFDINLGSQYKYIEQEIPLDYSCEDGGNTYCFDSIVYTFSGLMITGSGEDIPSGVHCVIGDENGNEILLNGIVGYDEDKFTLFYLRNSAFQGGKYTVTLYDNCKRNIKLYETEVEFK